MRWSFCLFALGLCGWVGYRFYPSLGLPDQSLPALLSALLSYPDAWLGSSTSLYCIAFGLYGVAAWWIAAQASRYLLLRLIYLALFYNPALLFTALAGTVDALLLALFLLGAAALFAHMRLQQPRWCLMLFACLWCVLALEPSRLWMVAPLVWLGFYALPRQYHALALWLKTGAMLAVMVFTLQLVHPGHLPVSAFALITSGMPLFSSSLFYDTLPTPAFDIFREAGSPAFRMMETWADQWPLIALWPYLLAFILMVLSHLTIQSRNKLRPAALALLVSGLIGLAAGEVIWIVWAASLGIAMWKWPPRDSLPLKHLQKKLKIKSAPARSRRQKTA